MKDTIRTRIARILTGSANSIVSKIEGLAPEVVLEQAIQEVDSAIDETKVEHGRIVAQRHHTTKALRKLEDEHQVIGEQMTVAKGEGREDLLEAAVSRQLDIEDQLPALQDQLHDLRQQEEEITRAISGLVAKRNEMEDELFDFKRSRASAAAQSEGVTGTSGGGAQAKADRADRAFSRVIANTTGVRREHLKASSAESEKLLELAKLNKRARIEARMREISDKPQG